MTTVEINELDPALVQATADLLAAYVALIKTHPASRLRPAVETALIGIFVPRVVLRESSG